MFLTLDQFEPQNVLKVFLKFYTILASVLILSNKKLQTLHSVMWINQLNGN